MRISKVIGLSAVMTGVIAAPVVAEVVAPSLAGAYGNRVLATCGAGNTTAYTGSSYAYTGANSNTCVAYGQVGVKVQYKNTSTLAVSNGNWKSANVDGTGNGAASGTLPSGYMVLQTCHGWGASSYLNNVRQIDSSDNVTYGCNF